MLTRYDVEIGEDSKLVACHCCGKESHVGHGFVYKDGNAHAVYYAGWSSYHSEKKVNIALALGEWVDGSTSDDRTCFGLEAYEKDDEILFRIIEPSESPWANTELLGKMLSRKDGLNHKLLKEVFSIAESVLRSHTAIKEYLGMSAETGSIAIN